MQVGTSGNTGGAHIADELSGSHILSRRDNVMGHVHIDGREAIQVVDADIVAGAACLVRSHGDFAGPGSEQGRCFLKWVVKILKRR